MAGIDAAAGQHETPRFLVVQYGARHGYAIPTAFHRAGALAGLYTDFTATNGAGTILARLVRSRGRFAAALSRRVPPAEIAAKIQTSGAAYLAGKALHSVLKVPNGAELSIRFAKSLAERTMSARGTGSATHVYTMLGEGGQFVRRAKEAGLGVVGDVYIALSADQIVAAEAQRFPDWSDERPREATIEELAGRNSILLSHSDLLICPSEFVRDDLIEHHGVQAARTLVVPYAVSPRWLHLATDPEPGRVLFAGSANIRKGIHYLASAAKLLKGCRFRVAGGVSAAVRRNQTAERLCFLDHLSAAEMAFEFARADVFALPSLAEGSASVTAEALGAGIPVVTTRAAGSIVRDGIDGIIVPERDPEALAEAIHSIVEDRDRRAAMSRAARERALAFTWEGFAKSVIEATLNLQAEKLV